jgi:dUTP pyrophosphatase
MVTVLVCRAADNPVTKAGSVVSPFPVLGTAGSACWDLTAWIDKPKAIWPRERPVAIPVGLEVAIPDGYEGQIRLRSGLAMQGIVIPNAPGTIDSDYRGEIKVLLVSLGDKVMIEPGQRIAQIAIRAVPAVEWAHVNELPATVRGPRGFGSTGF